MSVASGPRRSTVPAIQSAPVSALDSYIEKKRAMEERAKQIRQERSQNKVEQWGID